jgi:hypothetical protein
MGAQKPGAPGQDLAQVVAVWPALPSVLKAAILAIVHSAAPKAVEKSGGAQ